jgi:crotonobetainyl-CoA:carnitine CoA-transferase CaiB-like acyl-CoA transferase
MVAAVTPKNVEVLFDVIGHPEGKTDPRFATVAARRKSNWGALLELIEGWTRQRSGAECERILMAAGVPCSRYRSVAEAMDDPQLAERGFDGRAGRRRRPLPRAPTLPYRLSAHADARARPAGRAWASTPPKCCARSSASTPASWSTACVPRGCSGPRRERHRPQSAARRRGAHDAA